VLAMTLIEPHDRMSACLHVLTGVLDTVLSLPLVRRCFAVLSCTSELITDAAAADADADVQVDAGAQTMCDKFLLGFRRHCLQVRKNT
jgi:hypothetical protein